MRPSTTGSVTARPSPSRRRGRHRHRPGRSRDVAAAARLRPLIGGAGIRHRPARTWRDIGAAARAQSWCWPGGRGRRHRHARRSRAGVEPLQFLPVELVGHIVAGRRPPGAAPGRRAGSPCVPSMMSRSVAGVSMCRLRPSRPGARLCQGRHGNRENRNNGNAVQEILHMIVLRGRCRWTTPPGGAEPVRCRPRLEQYRRSFIPRGASSERHFVPAAIRTIRRVSDWR